MFPLLPCSMRKEAFGAQTSVRPHRPRENEPYFLAQPVEFTERETEAQRGLVSCSRSHSLSSGAWLGYNLSQASQLSAWGSFHPTVQLGKSVDPARPTLGRL